MPKFFGIFSKLFGRKAKQAQPVEEVVKPAVEGEDTGKGGPLPLAHENVPGAENVAPVTSEEHAEGGLKPELSTEAEHGHAHKHGGAWAGIKSVIVRVYALGVVALVVVPSVLAMQYMIRTVFVPTPVPQRFLEWQGQVDASSLRHENVPGVTGDAARAPLGHYHRLERWFQLDAKNSCTNEACHEPLPHTKKMKVPAFANFHTTFLSCEMCHRPANAGKTTWIELANNGTAQVPALLRLVRYLETQQAEIKDRPATAHGTIIGLLRGALTNNGNGKSLKDLLVQFETSEPGSPVWRRAVGRLEEDLPNHLRGEYGAKLALEAGGGEYAKRMDEMAELTKQYTAAKDGASRRTIKDKIHGPNRQPLACVSCHTRKDGAIEFEELGYSPRRSKVLGSVELARLMEKIRAGEQFFLPDLLGGSK